jgi:hypothetical protein
VFVGGRVGVVPTVVATGGAQPTRRRIPIHTIPTPQRKKYFGIFVSPVMT